MQKQMTTSLTFQNGKAEDAMNMYVELFDNSKVISIQRWPTQDAGEEGKIMQGRFELNGNQFLCSDSPAVHDWDFTPAVAIYIECDDEAEIERLFAKLSENGKVMMDINYDYGFSKKFGFVQDQYGVCWQLNLQ